MKFAIGIIAIIGVLFIASAAAKGRQLQNEPTGLQAETNDWVWKGHVLSPDNQGSCDADWAFAVMTAIEGQYSINTSANMGIYTNLRNFSEQFLIDCLGENLTNGDMCSSDITPQTALDFLIDTGAHIPKNWQYLYSGNQGECQIESNADVVNGAQVFSYNTLIEPSTDDMLAALENGPLIARLIGDEAAIQAYGSADPAGGFLTNCSDNDTTTEQTTTWVNIVGYHYKPWSGEQLLRVKMPYGPQWGDGGYLWLAAVPQDVDGICGIRQEVISVTANLAQ